MPGGNKADGWGREDRSVVFKTETINVESAFSGAATRLDHFSELIRRDTFRTPQQKLLPLIMHPADSLAAVPTAAVVATT